MKLILHIGMQKTGSTQLQSFLHQNRRSLKKHGVLYSESMRLGKKHSLSLVRNIGRNISDKDWNEKVNMLRDEMNDESIHTLILSDENMYPENFRIIDVLHPYFESIDVIFYARRQYDHLPSAYSQYIKGKGTKGIKRYYRQRQKNCYDFEQELKPWDRGKSKVKVFAYREEFDICRHFFDHNFIQIPSSDLTFSVTRKNRSYTSGCVYCKKRRNLISKYFFLRQLRRFEYCSWPRDNGKHEKRVVLSFKLKQKIYRKYLDRNEQFAKKYMSEDDAQYFVQSPE